MLLQAFCNLCNNPMKDLIINNNKFSHNKIRYYTPQPFRSSHQHDASNNYNSTLDRNNTDRDIDNNNNTNILQDRILRTNSTIDYRVETRHFDPKDFEDPPKAVRPVLRSRSLLRRPYTPNPELDEGSVVGRPVLKSHRTFASDSYCSGTQRILKQQSSSLSKAAGYHISEKQFLVLLKLKPRPKLEIPVIPKIEKIKLSDFPDDPEIVPSPTLTSRADAESKNFLHDMYLVKAEDCLDEFEKMKDTMDSRYSSKLLDRCIEFYEMALKALGNGRDSENSKILLRTKQSRVILKKRNIWRQKIIEQDKFIINNNIHDDKNNNNIHDNKSRGSKVLIKASKTFYSNNGKNSKDKDVANICCSNKSTNNNTDIFHINNSKRPKSMPTSSTASNTISLFKNIFFTQSHNIGRESPKDDSSGRLSDSDRESSNDNHRHFDNSYQFITLDRSLSECQMDNNNNINSTHLRDKSNTHITTSGSLSSAFSKITIPKRKSKRQLPKVPDSINGRVLDVTSRNCNGPDFVKISLV